MVGLGRSWKFGAMDYKNFHLVVIFLGIGLGITSANDDLCPFINGTGGFVARSHFDALHLVMMSPHQILTHPSPYNATFFHLKPLYAQLNASMEHCLVCAYNVRQRGVKISSRILCEDNGKISVPFQEVEAPKRMYHMYTISTKVDLPSGQSPNFGCKVGAFEFFVTSDGTAQVQCWLKPYALKQ